MVVVFFFKQKTAYGMRISDWSSDVCSSDLTDLVNADARTGESGIGKRGDESGKRIAMAGRVMQFELSPAHRILCGIPVPVDIEGAIAAHAFDPDLLVGDEIERRRAGDDLRFPLDRKSTRLNSRH